jgi:hypothetical protein
MGGVNSSVHPLSNFCWLRQFAGELGIHTEFSRRLWCRIEIDATLQPDGVSIAKSSKVKSNYGPGSEEV